MRLTLRTLLAHEHGLLNEQQSAWISQKIEQSPFVIQLLRHLRDRAHRREIIPLALDTRGLAAVTNVVRYLDHELPATDVVALENECFSSDRLLAEVASCHEILAQWLTMPTAVAPSLRHRLYGIIPSSSATESPAEIEGLWTKLPSSVTQPGQAEPLTNHSAHASVATSRSRSSRRPVLRAMVMAASVAVLVTLGLQYRDHVEEVLKQHLRNEVAWQTESSADQVVPPPGSFVVGTPPPEMLGKPLPEMPVDLVPETSGPEVATTAFHVPLEVSGTPSVHFDATNALWKVEQTQGAFFRPQAAAEWTLVEPGSPTFARKGEARLVVAQDGYCTFADQESQWDVIGPAEVGWQSDDEVVLRYGQLIWFPGESEQACLTVAGQTLRLENPSAAVRLRLTTAAVTLDGVDYSRDTSNQEVWIECLGETAQLQLSSWQAPLLLEEGETLVAHAAAGVRSDKRTVDARAPFTKARPWAQIENQIAPQKISGDLVSSLREIADREREVESTWAGELLAQLLTWEIVVTSWSTEISTEDFARQASRIRELLAQNQHLASRLERELLQTAPDHGPLVYRLVCGFSKDQRSETTLEQLRNLEKHPEASVRQWARFQLGVGVSSLLPSGSQ